MSNNNYKNYHNYQNYQKKNETNVEEKVEPAVVETEVVESVEEVKDVVVEETVVEEPKAEESKTINGVVVDCPRLRVRAAANKKAEVLCEINVGSQVVIDEKNSTDEFYKVCTEAGVEGYCMKQFIAVK